MDPDPVLTRHDTVKRAPSLSLLKKARFSFQPQVGAILPEVSGLERGKEQVEVD